MIPLKFVVIFVMTHFKTTDGYCWRAGYNPTFTAAPDVEQVNISTVRISWSDDIITHRHCADQFLIKYWIRSYPNKFEMTNLISTSENYKDVTVVPKTPYVFEAVAREDKGTFGVDWNKSPQVEFKTSTNFIPASDPPPPNEIVEKTENAEKTEPEAVRKDLTKEEYREAGLFGLVWLTAEILAGIIIAGVIILIVSTGVIYKLSMKKKSRDSNGSDEEADEEVNLAKSSDEK